MKNIILLLLLLPAVLGAKSYGTLPWNYLGAKKDEVSDGKKYCYAVTSRTQYTAERYCKKIANWDLQQYCYGVSSKDSELALKYCQAIIDSDMKKHCYGIVTITSKIASDYCVNIVDNDMKNHCYAATSTSGKMAGEYCEKITDSDLGRYCYAATGRRTTVASGYCKRISDLDSRRYCFAITSKDGDIAWSHCRDLGIHEDQENLAAISTQLLKENRDLLDSSASKINMVIEKSEKGFNKDEACPICYGDTTNAELSFCHHCFCSECISQYKESTDNPECPICRKKINSLKEAQEIVRVLKLSMKKEEHISPVRKKSQPKLITVNSIAEGISNIIKAVKEAWASAS